MKNHPTILLLIAALSVTAGCSEAPTAETTTRVSSDRSIPVIAEVLRFEREQIRLEAIGTSRARLSAELYAPTSGEVLSVNFKPGQAVAIGDVLIQLDAERRSWRSGSQSCILRMQSGFMIAMSVRPPAAPYCPLSWTPRAQQ